MILGIIPARGGSKGIPRKNIKPIAGKPLIAWTIEAAAKSKLMDRFVVSTEDDEIAAVARQYGAEVVKRPLALAGDDASTVDVLKNVAEQIPCDTVVLLQVTSPIRKDNLIDECIKEFQQKGFDSLATGFICKYVEYGKNTLRRQDIKGFFYDDGNVSVAKASFIKQGDRFGNKLGYKVISRPENIDIDDEFDMWMAEKILLEKKY
ncbi:MAG: acylneuraminate cytidylyltransferase family protein [Candidatus Omnitrophica bacterium]|nr:acylneuraminate cytidylyltransferase family protein [Candidatus Omnitrophota bacterium]